jgi:hypothetical protein
MPLMRHAFYYNCLMSSAVVYVRRTQSHAIIYDVFNHFLPPRLAPAGRRLRPFVLGQIHRNIYIYIYIYIKNCTFNDEAWMSHTASDRSGTPTATTVTNLRPTICIYIYIIYISRYIQTYSGLTLGPLLCKAQCDPPVLHIA